jgi:hypothetical protein
MLLIFLKLIVEGFPKASTNRKCECSQQDFDERDRERETWSHPGLAIYMKKYLQAKEEVMKTQIFHHAKI